jgi:hypothetical protein
MVFDVESVGLHGEAWAVGFVILDGGKFVSEAWSHCSPDEASGTDEGREWVKENCPWAPEHAPLPDQYGLPKSRFRRTPRDVRNWFWSKWLEEKERGTELWADVAWPVEARFLIACVEDLRAPRNYATDEGNRAGQIQPSPRCWEGPFPLLDVRSYLEALRAGGVDEGKVIEVSLETDLGLAGDELLHHPLYDARVSAQKVLTIDKLIRGLRGEG